MLILNNLEKEIYFASFNWMEIRGTICNEYFTRLNSTIYYLLLFIIIIIIYYLLIIY